MYWIYLGLFLLIIAIPVLITGDTYYLHEDSIETTLIACLGTIGFLLYVLQHKVVRQHLREKLRLQKKTSDATRDLSQSYSYIGEVNRKIDILENTIVRLPQKALKKAASDELLTDILEAMKLVLHTDEAILLWHSNDEWQSFGGSLKKHFPEVSHEMLLKNKKQFFGFGTGEGMMLRDEGVLCHVYILFRRQQHTGDAPEGAAQILLALGMLILVLAIPGTKKKLKKEQL
jgi:hypothetical protein